MKKSELSKIIREELSKVMTNDRLNEASLPSDVKEQLNDLISETIINALYEDMALSPEGFQLAIQYLIQGLKNQADLHKNMQH